MSYILKNNDLKVMFSAKGGRQGDARYWSGQAPVLFPICGSIRSNKAMVGGSKTTEMPCHGLVRKLDFQPEFYMADRVSFTISSDEVLLKQYPYPFLLHAEYRPPGVSSDFYKQLGLLAKQRGVPFLLDAYGELLRQGMEASPTLIKPNAEEYEATFGVTPKPIESFCRECRQLLDQHDIPYAIVSMGEEGALLIGPYDAWYSKPVHIDVKGVQGAGDSMVAGIAWAIANGRSLGGELLRVAVACAHASLELPGTQMCDAAGMEKRLDHVPLYQIDQWMPRR